MKKILVTGGAGFIGSRLCLTLLRQGHYVISADNYSTGGLENFQPIEKEDLYKNFVWGPMDVAHDPIEDLVSEIDEIYHLASPASPTAYQENPIDTMMTNVLGSHKMLTLAQKTGAKILLASTSEVYGNALEHPQSEIYNGNVNSLSPRACYENGKRAAETLFFDFFRKKKTKIKIARIFNTYGPGMAHDDGRVVSNFVTAALTDRPLIIYGDGENTRSFCFIDDTVEGLIALMETEESDSNLWLTGPINIGNSKEMTIKSLAQIVIDITGSKSQIVHADEAEADPVRRCPDLSLAKHLLGWVPKTGLTMGLNETIEYYREQLKNLKEVA